MKLEDCLCINSGLNLTELKELLAKEFDHYQFDFKSPYGWWESIPNPEYNPDSIPPDDEYSLEHREAVCGFDMQLKKAHHANFNVKCFSYQGNIYIHPCAYYYAKFNADNLKALLETLSLPDTFTLGDKIAYGKQSYKQWVDAHPDQKWAQHNYKCDKPDLAKIGIEV